MPCPACGYNLRNTTSQACPECGEALVLAVGTFAPRVGAWAFTLASAMLPVGFSGSFAAVGLTMWMRSTSWGNSDTVAVGGLVIATLIWLAIACFIYRIRGRFARWSARRRWFVAIAVFLAAAICNAVTIEMIAEAM